MSEKRDFTTHPWNKNNPCADCPYKSTVPGSGHHQKCEHPVILGSEFKILGLVLSGHYKLLGFTVNETGEKFSMITINEHGIEHGWANWPVDFDPIWIDSCGLKYMDQIQQEGINKDETV